MQSNPIQSDPSKLEQIQSNFIFLKTNQVLDVISSATELEAKQRQSAAAAGAGDNVPQQQQQIGAPCVASLRTHPYSLALPAALLDSHAMFSVLGAGKTREAAIRTRFRFGIGLDWIRMDSDWIGFDWIVEFGMKWIGFVGFTFFSFSQSNPKQFNTIQFKSTTKTKQHFAAAKLQVECSAAVG